MNTAADANWLGPSAALATFLGIWWGHVAVRRIEYHAPVLWLPAAGFSTLGLALLAASLLTPEPAASAVLGILGITFAWDALELFRQSRRVGMGHAPANPANPRHANFPAALPSHPTTRRPS